MEFPTGSGRPTSMQSCRQRRTHWGFTLIELLVVMVIIATLLSIVAPRYFASVDRAREAALRTNLRTMRDAIDKYVADKSRYPDSVEQLVTQKYLRSLPIDTITDRNDTWVVVPYPDKSKPGMFDVRSGAAGVALDGTAFSTW